jgi:glycerophosphoryl diester phosphodiesterase
MDAPPAVCQPVAPASMAPSPPPPCPASGPPRRCCGCAGEHVGQRAAAARLGAMVGSMCSARATGGCSCCTTRPGATDGRGCAARGWDELGTLDAGRWFDAAFAGERLPTLSRWLRCARAAPAQRGDQAGGWTVRWGWTWRVRSRDWPRAAAAAAAVQLQRCALHAARAGDRLPRVVRGRLPRLVDAAARSGRRRLRGPAAADSPQAASVKAHQVPLLAWTVNSALRAALSSWGVDGFTDRRIRCAGDLRRGSRAGAGDGRSGPRRRARGRRRVGGNGEARHAALTACGRRAARRRADGHVGRQSARSAARGCRRRSRPSRVTHHSSRACRPGTAARRRWRRRG